MVYTHTSQRTKGSELLTSSPQGTRLPRKEKSVLTTRQTKAWGIDQGGERGREAERLMGDVAGFTIFQDQIQSP